MTAWLIDKSALVRLGASPDAELWAGRIERGLIRITAMTRLEIGFSARTTAQARSAFTSPPLSAMPVEHLTPAIEDRALQVQLLLAAKRRQRAPSIPHLLIAATAELAGLTVLHRDKDFDRIAAITTQPCETLRTPTE